MTLEWFDKLLKANNAIGVINTLRPECRNSKVIGCRMLKI